MCTDPCDWPQCVASIFTMYLFCVHQHHLIISYGTGPIDFNIRDKLIYLDSGLKFAKEEFTNSKHGRLQIKTDH